MKRIYGFEKQGTRLETNIPAIILATDLISIIPRVYPTLKASWITDITDNEVFSQSERIEILIEGSEIPEVVNQILTKSGAIYIQYPL